MSLRKCTDQHPGSHHWSLFPKRTEMYVYVLICGCQTKLFKERHSSPTSDDLVDALNGAKVFSKLDLRSAVTSSRKQIHHHFCNSWRPERIQEVELLYELSQWNLPTHHQWANLWHTGSHQHQWWHHRIWKDQTGAWSSPTMIYWIWTHNLPRKMWVPQGFIYLLWASLLSKWSLTRSRESESDTRCMTQWWPISTKTSSLSSQQMPHPLDCRLFSHNTLLDMTIDELLHTSADHLSLLSSDTPRLNGKLLRLCGRLKGYTLTCLVDTSYSTLIVSRLNWPSTIPSPDHLHELRDGISIFKNATLPQFTQKVKTTHLTSCLDTLVQRYHTLTDDQPSIMLTLLHTKGYVNTDQTGNQTG